MQIMNTRPVLYSSCTFVFTEIQHKASVVACSVKAVPKFGWTTLIVKGQNLVYTIVHRSGGEIIPVIKTKALQSFARPKVIFPI